MSTPAAVLEQPSAALDPQVTLRAVTVAVGVTGGVWRLLNVVGIPVADATAAFVLGIALGLAQLGWTARLVARPSRRWLLAGAAGTAVSLLASVVVLASVPVGRDGIVPAVVGVGLQLTFLLLTLAGAVHATPARLMRQATRAGLVTVALTMSVLVAGGAQDHAHATGTDAGKGTASPAQSAAPRSLLCHLI
jgi:hypothetical protein